MKKIVKVLDNYGQRIQGQQTFISWERLVTGLLQRELCGSGDKIVQVEASVDGIKVFFESIHDYLGPDHDD